MNLEAEQSVIGAVLINNMVLPDILKHISSEHFLATCHKTFFKRIEHLWNKSEPIDFVTVLNGCEDLKQNLWDCAETVPIADDAEYYAQMVKEEYKRKKAFDFIDGLVKEGGDTKTLREKVGALSSMLEEEQSVNKMSASELIQDFFNRSSQKKEYIKTGFPRIDNGTYIEKGDFCIIGGRPSAGKTAFALNIMHNIAKKHKTVFFSLETNCAKLGERLVSINSGKSYSKIKQQDLDEDDFADIRDTSDYFHKAKFTVVEASGWSVSQIRAKALQEKAEVVFIDYIQLIHDTGKSQYEKVTQISKQLHAMAQTDKITVFGLAQLNRDGENGRPTMAHLRESGQIEQDADLIILLYRKEINKDENIFEHHYIIEKNKEGLVGNNELKFYGDTMRFTEVAKN